VSEDADEQGRLDFLAATYFAVLDNDDKEDAIWEEYNC